MPGLRVHESLSIITGETPYLIHLPELPARGPGADLVGRTFAMLHALDSDFAVETTPTGWRVSAGEPREMRRATSWLGEDLDAIELAASEESAWVKSQICGPLTLAASVEPAMGERLVSDVGARRAFAEAVSEVAIQQLAQLRRRLPNAKLILQVDEPGLQAVVSGSIPTRSGRSRIAPVAAAEAAQLLGQVSAAIHQAGFVAWVHSCADFPQWQVLEAAKFDGWSLPAYGIVPETAEALAAHLDRGGQVVLGYDAVSEQWSSAQVVGSALRLLSQLGFGEATAAECALLSHTCGLAFANNPAQALRRLTEAARGLAGTSEQRS